MTFPVENLPDCIVSCVSHLYKLLVSKCRENTFQMRFIVKEKYRGMFEIQKSRDKTSSREIGLDIRTHVCKSQSWTGPDRLTPFYITPGMIIVKPVIRLSGCVII